jgi:hypothetical protein
MNLGPAPDYDTPGRPLTLSERVVDALGCSLCTFLLGVVYVLAV